MKNFLLLLFILVPAFVFATSGACSSHGGVDCSAGRDWDGSVICNDGWTNSSVAYSDMVMCQSSSSLSTYCPTPQYFGTSKMSTCDQHQALCDKRNQGLVAGCRSASITGRTSTNQDCSSVVVACTEAVRCREEVARNKETEERYNKCVQTVTDNMTARLDLIKKQNEELDILIKKAQEISAKNDRDLNCSTQFGSAYYDDSIQDCICKDGHSYNDLFKRCLSIRVEQPKVVVPPTPTTPVPSQPVKKVETPKPLVKTEIKKEVKVEPEIETPESTPLPVAPTIQVTPEIKSPWYSRMFKVFSGWFN